MTALLISLFFGCGIALVVWVVFQLFNAVPVENRQYLDRPPLGFRIIWPLIQLGVFQTGRFVDKARIDSTLANLKAAGIEYSVSPQQFIVAKFISAGVFGLLFCLCSSLLFTSYVWLGMLGLTVGFLYPDLWLKELKEKRVKAILKTLPFYLDIITLSIEAGAI